MFAVFFSEEALIAKINNVVNRLHLHPVYIGKKHVGFSFYMWHQDHCSCTTTGGGTCRYCMPQMWTGSSTINCAATIQCKLWTVLLQLWQALLYFFNFVRDRRKESRNPFRGELVLLIVLCCMVFSLQLSLEQQRWSSWFQCSIFSWCLFSVWYHQQCGWYYAKK